MVKRIWFLIVITTLFLSALFTVSAQPMPHHGRYSNDPYLALYNGKVKQILEQNKDKRVTDLTVGEITQLMDRLSVAKQEYAYVKRSEGASYVMPGLGQYMNGDPLNGTLFLGGDLILAAGTLVGAYYLLPSNLQFSSINYFRDSFDSIRNAWNGHSFVDYLPAAAVLAGGAIIRSILKGISARHAGRLAEQRISEGKVTFKPVPLMIIPGSNGPGFGFGMRMDY